MTPRHPVRACVFAVLAGFVLADAAQAQIYTWRDERGILVLSDQPAAPAAKPAAVSVPGTATLKATRPISAGTDVGRFDAIIDRESTRRGVRSELVRAVIHVESAFDPNARSPKGAMGLMQLMPGTAEDLGVVNAYDPEQNIRGGVAYLQTLLDLYQGDEVLALAAYNAGPGAVTRYGNQVPPYAETRAYVDKVKSSTDLESSGGDSKTIYKSYRDIGGRKIPVYTNIKPASGDYEVATRPR